MGFTPEQIKGRIKSVAKQNNADARTLMRIYMMERFLERLAQSEYRDNFIIKGGILVTAMIGVAHRSTMDIDTSMKNLNLSAEDALRVVNQVKDIDLDDGVSFDVKDVSNIMDEMEYPGIRVTMNANVGRLITPLKIDISTGDVITPRAIEFNYDLLLEDTFLLDVFAEVLKIDSQAHLVLLGDGELMDEIKRKAADLGISEHVTFVGNVGNANEWYQAFDCFVLPSIWEGLPVVGVEAQAADLPCVFSSAITREIGLSQHAKFVPLTESVSVWAKTLCDALQQNERNDNTKLITEHHYNIAFEAKKLQERYLQLAGEVK